MGNKEKQEVIYLEYKDKVTGYIRGKVSNQADVDELVSKVFLKVVEKFDTFDSSKASISTWIYTITGNTVIDYYRGQKIYSEVDESFSYIDEGFNEITNKETLEELANALEKLDERSRDLIILHYYSGYKLKEVAEIMKMSYSNLRKIHDKAIATLGTYMS